MAKPNKYITIEKATDFRGNTYRVGDTVVYAGMSGRSAQLIEATVLEIQLVDNTWSQAGDFVQPRLKLQPTGRYSRWEQHYTYDYNKQATVAAKPVLVSPEMVAWVNEMDIIEIQPGDIAQVRFKPQTRGKVTAVDINYGRTKVEIEGVWHRYQEVERVDD